MAQSHTMPLAGRADWALMIAIHDALRRDLDQLLHPSTSHASARARWSTFRSQLRFHLAAEHAAMWPRVTAKLAGDPRGQALLDAMDDEALPLISEFLSPGELGGIAAAIRGRSTWRVGTTVPWALADASPDIRERVLSQLPAPARLLYRTVWLPRYARTTPVAMKNTRPSQPVTSSDATRGPLTAVSPADHMAPMPGRFTGPALRALVIRHARCSDGGLDPDQWFPVSADPGRARQEAAAAIAICTTCPVRGHCLTLSLQHLGHRPAWRLGRPGRRRPSPTAPPSARRPDGIPRDHRRPRR